MIKIRLESQEQENINVLLVNPAPKKVIAEIEEPSPNLIHPEISIFIRLFVRALFAIGYTRQDINNGFRSYVKNIKHTK